MSLKDDFSKGLRELPHHLRSHKGQTILLAVLLAWALFTMLAPLAMPHGTIGFDDEGVVGDDEHSAQIDAIGNPVLEFVYDAGDFNCHQRHARSFDLAGNQMPFCARCTAIFVGFPVGLLLFFVVRRELNPLLLLLAFVPIGIDGGLQLVTDYESSNLLRVVTGGLAGGATGYALGYIAKEFGLIFSSMKAAKR